MVATISVLGGGARGVAAYFTATSGYYDLERRGEWFGTATEKLGLSGEVDRHEFEMLLAGFTPGGDRLARKTSAPSARSSRQAESGDVPGNQGKRRADRVPGYDVCFSAPKSVSLLWAVGSKQVRTEIESCMTDAVSKTLKDMESLLPLARRGRNGTQQIQAELATAMFLHTTSRDLDPQLHVHSVIPNLCYGSDGRWGSVNSRMLHTWTPALGRVFRCHLGQALIERMNVELERPVRDDGKLESWFEVKGVSKEAIKEFSQRRQAIEKATPRDQLGDSHARAKANKETRRSKEPDANLKTLREQWRERGKRFGLTEKNVEQICGQSVERHPLARDDLNVFFDEANQALGKEKAHYRDWNVVSQVC